MGLDGNLLVYLRDKFPVASRLDDGRFHAKDVCFFQEDLPFVHSVIYSSASSSTSNSVASANSDEEKVNLIIAEDVMTRLFQIRIEPASPQADGTQRMLSKQLPVNPSFGRIEALCRAFFAPIYAAQHMWAQRLAYYYIVFDKAACMADCKLKVQRTRTSKSSILPYTAPADAQDVVWSVNQEAGVVECRSQSATGQSHLVSSSPLCIQRLMHSRPLRPLLYKILYDFALGDARLRTMRLVWDELDVPIMLHEGLAISMPQCQNAIGEAELAVVWHALRHRHEAHVILLSGDSDLLPVAALHGAAFAHSLHVRWPNGRVFKADDVVPRLQKHGWQLGPFVLSMIMNGTDFVDRGRLFYRIEKKYIFAAVQRTCAIDPEFDALADVGQFALLVRRVYALAENRGVWPSSRKSAAVPFSGTSLVTDDASRKRRRSSIEATSLDMNAPCLAKKSPKKSAGVWHRISELPDEQWAHLSKVKTLYSRVKIAAKDGKRKGLPLEEDLEVMYEAVRHNFQYWCTLQNGVPMSILPLQSSLAQENRVMKKLYRVLSGVNVESTGSAYLSDMKHL
jgi:hypothetical protein